MSNGAMAETGLTFDDILGAVQESGRGRWFLEEFQKRHEDKGSAKILAAISKIESRIEAMAHVHEPAGELSKLRGAIATARREIALQETSFTELSAEGRMFAKLAEMARKTLPASPANDASVKLTSSVVRALNLIDEIDVTLNAPGSPLAANTDTYFKADAALFEPPVKPPRPILVSVPAAQPVQKALVEPAAISQAKEDEPKRGARLVINRLGAPASGVMETTQITGATVATPAPVVDEATAQTVVLTTTAVAETKATQRIVIVRRKPEDMQTVPLAELASESAA